MTGSAQWLSIAPTKVHTGTAGKISFQWFASGPLRSGSGSEAASASTACLSAEERCRQTSIEIKFALFPRANIAHDAGIEKTDHSATEFTLGHNVRSEVEVDSIIPETVTAGAKLVKPAQKTFWGGYARYFQDPDGHLQEVVYNPVFLPED